MAAASGDALLEFFEVPIPTNPLLSHLTDNVSLSAVLNKQLETLKSVSSEERKIFKQQCEVAKTEASKGRHYDALKLLREAMRQLDNQDKAQILSGRLALLYAKEPTKLEDWFDKTPRP